MTDRIDPRPWCVRCGKRWVPDECVDATVTPCAECSVVAELRDELARFKSAHEPGRGKMGFYAKDDFWDFVLANLDAAERALELEAFIREHGDTLQFWVRQRDLPGTADNAARTALGALLERLDK